MTRGDDHRLADILTAAPSTDVASATITGAQLSSTHTDDTDCLSRENARTIRGDEAGGASVGMIVRFPDGTSVQATGLGRDGSDPLPDFALYLDAGWKHEGVAWDNVVLDWPDFGLPGNVDTAFGAIRDAFALARSGQRVEVGCLGGIGRTGTVLACMAILAGVRSEDAVGWVRANYRPGAVETVEQQQLVADFGSGDGRDS